jgi:hypothetical protein
MLPEPNGLGLFAGTDRGEKFLLEQEHGSLERASRGRQAAVDPYLNHGHSATAKNRSRLSSGLDALTERPFWLVFRCFSPIESPCVSAQVAYNSVIV